MNGTYLGASTTGSGKPLPVNPKTGALDINALVGQIVDRRKYYFYDTLKLAPGATVSSTPYMLFKNPIGSGDPYNNNITKTELETNMTDNGKFNPPYDLILNNIGFYFLIGNQLYDIAQIVNYCWFEFKILEKRMFMGHLWRHPPGAGLFGYSTKTSQQSWQNGMPMPGQVYWFGDYKKYIPPLVNFSLTINFPETMNNFFNSNLGADQIAAGQSGTALPTLQTTGQGGNGIQLIAILNGLSDSPVQ
jgi:hypothetical protein